MAEQGIKARNDALARHLGEKLDVPGDDLAAVTARAGRELPRGVRAEARYLVLAETMAAHPKLHHLVDPRRARTAERALRRHVRGRDPARERTTRRLGVLAGIVFGLLVFFALVIWALAWRGVIGPGT